KNLKTSGLTGMFLHPLLEFGELLAQRGAQPLRAKRPVHTWRWCGGFDDEVPIPDFATEDKKIVLGNAFAHAELNQTAGFRRGSPHDFPRRLGPLQRGDAVPEMVG